MSAQVSLRKGWCPTLEKPMQSGDGLLVRLPLRHRTVSSSLARSIAEMAARYGNGHIDLTSRANVQIRGVTPEGYEALLAKISALGMYENNYNGHVIASPLAGVDSSCHPDTCALADAIENELSAAPRLPVKFMIVVDGGGMVPLHGLPSDICVSATGHSLFALYLGEAPQPLCTLAYEQVVPCVDALIQGFMRIMESHTELRRMRNVRDHLLWKEICAPYASPAAEADSDMLCTKDCLGFLPLPGSDSRGALGIGVALGRMEQDTLIALADISETYGNGMLHLAPWRTLFIPGIDASQVTHAQSSLNAQGFIIHSGDPRRLLHACPGAPACSSALGDTRSMAVRIANEIPDLASRYNQVHVSGCAKGCAFPGKSAVVVTATESGYGIAFDDHAGGAPVHSGLGADEVLKELQS